jgi:hypothetical protein
VLVQRLSTSGAATLKKVILDANSSATLPFAFAPRRLAAASSDADRADGPPGYITPWGSETQSFAVTGFMRPFVFVDEAAEQLVFPDVPYRCAARR